MTHKNIISNLSDRITIWRYMDFTKYIDLLDTKTLYFPNPKRFEDPLDSSFWSITGRTLGPRNDKDASTADDIRYRLNDYSKSITWVNCWHMNKVESAALWKLYLKSDEGIAIKSTSGRLKKALSECPYELHIDKIVYMEGEVYNRLKGHSTTTVDVAKLKHPSFKHEKEIRAIIIKDQTTEGIRINIDPAILIQKVYVAPKTPPWLKKLVMNVTKKYGYNFEVVPSELYQERFR